MTTGGSGVRQEWEPEDLIEVWRLLKEDQERMRNKSGANRLGFALLLKFFEVEARFPENAGEIPVPAVSTAVLPADALVPARRRSLRRPGRIRRRPGRSGPD
ncbi:DUF4158 domain-containing protein [Streptomyces sp. NPDC001221]